MTATLIPRPYNRYRRQWTQQEVLPSDSQAGWSFRFLPVGQETQLS
jgi:hypothetical protein